MEFGFKKGNYKKVIVTMGWTDDAKVEPFDTISQMRRLWPYKKDYEKIISVKNEIWWSKLTICEPSSLVHRNVKYCYNTSMFIAILASSNLLG